MIRADEQPSGLGVALTALALWAALTAFVLNVEDSRPRERDDAAARAVLEPLLASVRACLDVGAVSHLNECLRQAFDVPHAEGASAWRRAVFADALAADYALASAKQTGKDDSPAASGFPLMTEQVWMRHFGDLLAGERKPGSIFPPPETDAADPCAPDAARFSAFWLADESAARTMAQAQRQAAAASACAEFRPGDVEATLCRAAQAVVMQATFSSAFMDTLALTRDPIGCAYVVNYAMATNWRHDDQDERLHIERAADALLDLAPADDSRDWSGPLRQAYNLLFFNRLVVTTVALACIAALVAAMLLLLGCLRLYAPTLAKLVLLFFCLPPFLIGCALGARLVPSGAAPSVGTWLALGLASLLAGGVVFDVGRRFFLLLDQQSDAPSIRGLEYFGVKKTEAHGLAAFRAAGLAWLRHLMIDARDLWPSRNGLARCRRLEHFVLRAAERRLLDYLGGRAAYLLDNLIILGLLVGAGELLGEAFVAMIKERSMAYCLQGGTLALTASTLLRLTLSGLRRRLFPAGEER